MNGPILAALRSAAGKDTREVESARKGQGKKCGKKEQQRCSADAADCRAQILLICGDNAQCVASGTPCCDACSADGLLTCLLTADGSASRNALVSSR